MPSIFPSPHRYTDLLEMSEPLLHVLAYRPDSTLLFVPVGAMETVLRLLLKVSTAAGNCFRKDAKARKKMEAKGKAGGTPKGGFALPLEWSTPYELLLATITRLRREWRIPVIIFNAPAPM
jgi:hypothetical protein